jgi:hypothetical protein
VNESESVVRSGTRQGYGPEVTRFGKGVIVVAASAAVMTVAACGPAGTGKSASTAASSSSAMPTDAAGVSTLLHESSSKLSSAHIDMTVGVGTLTVTGSGDETLAHGKLQSLDLSENVPSVGALRVIIVGAKTYLQLPTALSHSTKPWVLVTSTSANPAVRQLATTLQSVQQAAALDQFTAFSSAATIDKHDQENLNGTPTTHYSLTVDVQKLPDTLPGKQQLVTAGLTTLPVEMWIDEQGRPVKVSENLTVQAQQVSTVVTIGKFDAPVTVTPPPADQVATD